MASPTHDLFSSTVRAGTEAVARADTPADSLIVADGPANATAVAAVSKTITATMSTPVYTAVATAIAAAVNAAIASSVSTTSTAPFATAPSSALASSVVATIATAIGAATNSDSMRMPTASAMLRPPGNVSSAMREDAVGRVSRGTGLRNGREKPPTASAVSSIVVGASIAHGHLHAKYHGKVP